MAAGRRPSSLVRRSAGVQTLYALVAIGRGPDYRLVKTAWMVIVLCIEAMPNWFQVRP